MEAIKKSQKLFPFVTGGGGGGGGESFVVTKLVNPIALRKAKIVSNFGLSECNRIKNKPHKPVAK